VVAASCGGAGDGGGASVSISSPEDGATVASPFEVAMEAEGFAVEPAGNAREGAGHFHLMVDADCVAAGEQIPQDDAHRHHADGATETQLQLPAGEHTLCLQAGDGEHTALDLTHEITITVGAGEAAGEGEGDMLDSGPEEWAGEYEGTATWPCAEGPQDSTLKGRYEIDVDEDLVAVLNGSASATGGCLGPGVGAAQGDIRIIGARTRSGFRFPAAAWGVPGSFTIRQDGLRAFGTLRRPHPAGGLVVIEFEVLCQTAC
jgi:hypothetical protein